jgi:hypothetical protein
MTADDFFAVVHHNPGGAFLMVKQGLPAHETARRGPHPASARQPDCSASPSKPTTPPAKGGIYSLMRCLAIDGAQHQILANHPMPAARTRISAADPAAGDPAPGSRTAARTSLRTRLRRGPHYLPASARNAVTGGAFSSAVGNFTKFRRRAARMADSSRRSRTDAG